MRTKRIRRWPGYEEARRRYRDEWQLIDRVLYDLCRRRVGPQSERARITATVALIGRTYVTGIERAVKLDKTKPSTGPSRALRELASHLLQEKDTLKGIVGRLKRVREPITDEKLKRIVRGHGEVVELLRPILRRRGRRALTLRSFAAKYLHFHAPVVPIFDSYVRRSARRLFSWERRRDGRGSDNDGDDAYHTYVTALFGRFYQALDRSRQPVNVRLLDYYLLWLGENPDQRDEVRARLRRLYARRSP
jgi:hypothetical protein